MIFLPCHRRWRIHESMYNSVLFLGPCSKLPSKGESFHINLTLSSRFIVQCFLNSIIKIQIKFLWGSTFHNNRLNALYISALVIRPIAFLFNLSQLPGEYTTWATVVLKEFLHTHNQPLPSYVPIHTRVWSEAIIGTNLTQGNKCQDWDQTHTLMT